MSCDLVLSHIGSLAPRQFAVIGVDLDLRPHARSICQMMIEQARGDGLEAVLYELPGPHPDELRSRLTEVQKESSLLDFFSWPVASGGCLV